METRIARIARTMTFSALLLVLSALTYAGALAIGMSLALRAIQALALTVLSAPRL